MALSAEDKRRLVELAQKGRGGRPAAHQEDDQLNLAGNAATPIPLHLAGLGRGRNLLGMFRGGGARLLATVLVAVGVLAGIGAYVHRYDLHRMDFGAVFDSSRGLTMRHRFMEQVELQKKKRRLLDDARGFGFANDHMAAVHNTDQVLALEPDNAEALALRAKSLDQQVVFAGGALRRGDVDEAIARVQRVLAIAPAHQGARGLLRDCTDALVRRARAAFDGKDYEAAGDLVAQAEATLPGYGPAVALHDSLVQLHVRRADDYYLEENYVAALEEIQSVRRLEDHTPRADALFAKIDERIGFPNIQINSVVTVRGQARIIATINGKSVHLRTGQEFANIRVASIQQRTGEVIIEQRYTGEQQRLVKAPGVGGEWIAARR